MSINQFIKYWSEDDGPIGDLSKDLMAQSDFPFKESDEDVMKSLESETNRLGLTTIFREFKSLFENQK